MSRVAVAISVLCVCYSMFSCRNTRTVKVDVKGGDVTENGYQPRGYFLIKYSSYNASDFRKTHHPLTSVYIVYDSDTGKLNIPVIEGNQKIPFILSLNGGHRWGNVGYYGDILGCCEYENIKKGYNAVLEQTVDSITVEKYKRISDMIRPSMLERNYTKFEYRKMQWITTVYVLKLIDVEMCICPYYQSESREYSMSNDSLIYFTHVESIVSLNADEQLFFERLFRENL